MAVHSTLYRCLPRAWFRLDVLPWALVYPVVFAAGLAGQAGPPLWVLVVLPVLLALHVVTHLSTHWSVGCRAFIAFTKVKSVREATHVRAVPPTNCGSEELAPLEFFERNDIPTPRSVKLLGKEYRLPYARFSFQKTMYCYWDESARAEEVQKLGYPVNGPVPSFVSSKGYSTREQIRLAQSIWGDNVFEIPMPTFLQLFKEHAVAPLFVFQVLCVLLWSLDDYWYYSLLTLVLLVVFEGTVCNQRQRSLELLRSMRRPAYPVYVYREGQWQHISSDALVPGDVVSLGKMTVAPSEGAKAVGRDRGGKLLRREGQVGEGGAAVTEKLVPCDVLLLRGSCIVNEAMLTGESTPQMKEAIDGVQRSSGSTQGEEVFDLGAGVSGDVEVRSHVVFGGTKIIQQAPHSTTNGSKAEGASVAGGLPKPPDKGGVGVVLRTGFETSQGQLMRTIIFATRRVTAASAETALFIGILLILALAASTVVLIEGLKDEGRNRFKLILHCIMIVTSVVPPELPMELSLAVTNSLAALTRSLIYCTEPFRIPYAGKVTVCCFDKTGTLTADDLVLQGVVLLPDPDHPQQTQRSDGAVVEDLVLPPTSICGPSLWVTAGCHSLMMVDGKLAGDPMERAAMEGVGWLVSGAGDLAYPADRHTEGPIKILHRYPFSSALRRMSVLASRTVESGQKKEQLVILTKGAPEALEPLFVTVPPSFTATYLHHMGRGRRVLALAYRVLAGVEPLKARQLSREEAEGELTFAGLMIVDCPLKKDTAGVLKELRASRHRTVMITGDSALTAAEVARQVGMVPHGPERTLHLVQRKGKLGWESLADLVKRLNTRGNGKDESALIPFSLEGLERVSREGSLIVEGDGLAQLVALHGGAAPAVSDVDDQISTQDSGHTARRKSQESGAPGGTKPVALSRQALRCLSRLCPHVAVFARVAPDQKEQLIAGLNAAGETTLMCGDGTNDVGALKQAHVGVSIVNSPELEKRAERRSVQYERRLEELALQGQDQAGEADKARFAQLLAELTEQENDPSIIQLGDASIASPFTAKRTSIECVLAVIRQGRCTLVTTLQVYKILALNCLVSAYMLSSLYLYGVKQGDGQMTIAGLVVAVLFYLVSRAEPLEKLSAERPPSNIFCAQVILSIILQFVVHLACLLVTLEMAQPYARKEDPSMQPDGPFRPNIVNTAIFLLSSVMQLNTFIANYRGRPFMQSLVENKALMRFSVFVYGCLALLVSELWPWFNGYMQLVPLPSVAFRLRFGLLLISDTVLVIALDKACLRIKPA